MKTRLITALLAILGLLTSGCALRVVAPGEAGLIWRPLSDGVDPEPRQPGTIVHPIWEDVITYSVQVKTYQEQVVVLSKDDLKIAVTSSVIARPIVAELAALNQNIGPKWYGTVVKPKFRTTIRNVLANYTMHEISKSTNAIEDELIILLKRRLNGQHIQIEDVIVDDIKFSQMVLGAVEQKLAKEQEQQQMRFELNIAEQNAQIALIKARAKAEAAKIEAKGQAEAQEIISNKLTSRYLQFKALESPASKYFFMPQGKDGLPLMINPDAK